MKGLIEYIGSVNESKTDDFNTFVEILNSNRVGIIGPNESGDVYIVPAKCKFSKICVYPSLCIKFKEESSKNPTAFKISEKETNTVLPIIVGITNDSKKTYKEIDVKDKLDIEDGYYKFTEKNARFIVEELKKLS